MFISKTHSLKAKQKITFYQELQKQAGLDLRDRRGKQHKVFFILLGQGTQQNYPEYFSYCFEEIITPLESSQYHHLNGAISR